MIPLLVELGSLFAGNSGPGLMANLSLSLKVHLCQRVGVECGEVHPGDKRLKHP